MFYLYVYESFNIQYRVFDSLDGARAFFNRLTVSDSCTVVIESKTLSEPVILKQPTTK